MGQPDESGPRWRGYRCSWLCNILRSLSLGTLGVRATALVGTKIMGWVVALRESGAPISFSCTRRAAWVRAGVAPPLSPHAAIPNQS